MEKVATAYAQAVQDIDDKMLTDPTHHPWYNHVTQLPEDQRTTYLAIIFHDQVMNGGFHQYFFNGYGLFVNQTIPILKKIGAAEAAQLLAMAYATVNWRKEPLAIFRDKIYHRSYRELTDESDMTQALYALSDQYFDKEIDVESLLIAYLS